MERDRQRGHLAPSSQRLPSRRSTKAISSSTSNPEFLADEVTRQETTSALIRARAAGLEPTMCLENWDDTSGVTDDRQTWSELCSLRFIDGVKRLISPEVSTDVK